MAKKKLLCICVLAGAMVCLAGCSGPSIDLKPGSATQSIAQVLESEMEKADAENSADDNLDGDEGISETNNSSNETNDNQQELEDTSETTSSDAGDTSSSQDSTVDANNAYIGNVDKNIADSDYIDLTGMSADMIYAVVYDMVSRAETYKGKTVRIEGLYSYYKDPNTNEEWYACIIEDARACCATGIEFIPLDTYKNPDDFPELLEAITVKGTFDYTLDESAGFITLILRDATLG